MLDSEQDQDYTYDGLHRLRTSVQTGTANDASWELDQLGNWDSYTKWGTTETRTHNVANELETISSAANPVYDKAGNMTTMPRLKAMGSTYAAKYDAWNRLTQLENGTTASYEYDGRRRRIVRTEGSTTKRSPKQDDANLEQSGPRYCRP